MGTKYVPIIDAAPRLATCCGFHPELKDYSGWKA